MSIRDLNEELQRLQQKMEKYLEDIEKEINNLMKNEDWITIKLIWLENEKRGEIAIIHNTKTIYRKEINSNKELKRMEKKIDNFKQKDDISEMIDNYVEKLSQKNDNERFLAKFNQELENMIDKKPKGKDKKFEIKTTEFENLNIKFHKLKKRTNGKIEITYIFPSHILSEIINLIEKTIENK